MPGGCVIGTRPIDLHLKALRALGAEIEIEHGYIRARAPRGLRGTGLYLGGAFGSSVLGTATAMMAATLAEGRTVIDHAAQEPEVADLGAYLVAAGASIEGLGTPFTFLSEEAGHVVEAELVHAEEGQQRDGERPADEWVARDLL